MAGSAHADLLVTVRLSTQEATVRADNKVIATWPVATARPGYTTPTGIFRPQAMYRRHRSSKYKICNVQSGKCIGAPMNDAIYFAGANALHAGSVRKRSHGCVHIEPKNAAKLFDLVRSYGRQATTIAVVP